MQVRITVLGHESTDLMNAVSADLPGFMVAGYSLEELKESVPDVLTCYLASGGAVVQGGRLKPVPGWTPCAEFVTAVADRAA